MNVSIEFVLVCMQGIHKSSSLASFCFSIISHRLYCNILHASFKSSCHIALTCSLLCVKVKPCLFSLFCIIKLGSHRIIIGWLDMFCINSDEVILLQVTNGLNVQFARNEPMSCAAGTTLMDAFLFLIFALPSKPKLA